MSNSQYQEESYILDSVKLCTGRRLLDIGAWDPRDKSNSRGLIQQGWSAVLIEPSPGPLRNLVKEYGYAEGITIIGAAMSVSGGLATLEITDDALSTQNVAPEWREQGGYFGKLTVPTIAVADFFAQFGGDFDFVSIDTEGLSVEILIEMLRVGPRPRCICVEHDNRIVEIAQHAETANYRQLHLNGTNVVLEWTGKA